MNSDLDKVIKHSLDIDHLSSLVDTATSQLVSVGLKALGALVLFFVGRWLIKFALRLMDAGFVRQDLDHTLITYIHSAVSVGLNIILIIAMLGYFGVETTSFAALIAAMGIAIGAAWAGLLANFAAGVFLIVLRPFKVGDIVSVGGVTGKVKEIGLFSTIINTSDNIQTAVGNNKIFSENIQNYSANAYRRVDLTAQIAYGVDVDDAITRLKEALKTIPNVLSEPAAEVAILEFTANGILLVVRPYCHNNYYWQVYFATNALIEKVFSEAGYLIQKQPVVKR